MKCFKIQAKWLLIAIFFCSSGELWSMHDTSRKIFNNFCMAFIVADLIVLADDGIYHLKNYALQNIPSSQILDAVLSKEQRLQMFEETFQDKNLYSAINIPLLVHLTSGWSCGKLKKLMDEALRLAKQEGADFIAMKHLDAAKNNIQKGLQTSEKYFPWIDEFLRKSKKNVAIHEAGHAVAHAYNRTDRLHHATAEFRQLTHGFVVSLKTHTYDFKQKLSIEEKISEAVMDIIGHLGGGVTDQVFGLAAPFSKNMLTDKDEILKFFSRHGMRSDMDLAYTKASHLVYYEQLLLQVDTSLLTEAEIQEAIDNALVRLYSSTYDFIVAHKSEVVKVANLLLQKGSVSGEEIYDLLQADMPLYDFEAGPLPKGLVETYLYRGDYKQHEKDVAYNEYRAQFLQKKPTLQTVSLSPLPQAIYQKVATRLAATPPSENLSDDEVYHKYGRLVEVD